MVMNPSFKSNQGFFYCLASTDILPDAPSPLLSNVQSDVLWRNLAVFCITVADVTGLRLEFGTVKCTLLLLKFPATHEAKSSKSFSVSNGAELSTAKRDLCTECIQELRFLKARKQRAFLRN
jgi:hypothetical protein